MAFDLSDCWQHEVRIEECLAPEDSLSTIEKTAERAADLCQQMLAYAGKGQLHKIN
jgi:hypothetical protein